MTSLKIFPVTFIEGSFIDYQALPPAKALQEILALLSAVKKVNGTFISLWHNHTVSETNEFIAWRNVHNEMIKSIAQTFT